MTNQCAAVCARSRTMRRIVKRGCIMSAKDKYCRLLRSYDECWNDPDSPSCQPPWTLLGPFLSTENFPNAVFFPKFSYTLPLTSRSPLGARSEVCFYFIFKFSRTQHMLPYRVPENVVHLYETHKRARTTRRGKRVRIYKPKFSHSFVMVLGAY